MSLKMTNNEALKWHRMSYQAFIDSMWDGDEENNPFDQAFIMAISALEKQIPKKLKPHKSGGWICTKCKAFFEKTGCNFIDISYCPYCGQAIDWSE